jgi:orotate phosphoribosyltransferase
MVIVKSRAEDHGRGGKIEGALESGKRVLLVEDLVNKGTSCISAAEALRGAGAIVTTCLSLFTYGLAATSQRFFDKQLTLLSLSELESLLMIGVENSVISREQQQVVKKWADDPESWMKGG